MNYYTFKNAAGTTQHAAAMGAGTSGDPFKGIIRNEASKWSTSITYSLAQLQGGVWGGHGVGAARSLLITFGNSTDVQVKFSLFPAGWPSGVAFTVPSGRTATIYPGHEPVARGSGGTITYEAQPIYFWPVLATWPYSSIVLRIYTTSMTSGNVAFTIYSAS